MAHALLLALLAISASIIVGRATERLERADAGLDEATNYSTVLRERFDGAPLVDTLYCDLSPATCTHALKQHSWMPTVAGPGFETFYMNTLGADGSAALNTCAADGSTGADIGVQLAPDGETRLFALRASAADAFTVICTREVDIEVPSGLASVSLYLAQAGWHEAADELRVWADVDGGERLVTLLPQCAARATRETIDVLGLRAETEQPGSAYTGAPNTAGDPALLEDSWRWRTLEASLGQVQRSVRLCVGLQSGTGYARQESVFVRELLVARGPSRKAEECSSSSGGSQYLLEEMATNVALAAGRRPGTCQDGQEALLHPPYSTKCGPGRAEEEGVCRRCPVGTWSAAIGLASRGECTPCPSGSFSGVLGATSNNTCTPCRAGWFAGEGAGFCSACPAGSTSEPGASACTLCEAGTWSDEVGTCMPCPMGTYSAALGAASSATCTPCREGMFAGVRASGSCEFCPAGSWSFEGVRCVALLLPCAAFGALLAAALCLFARRAQRHRRLALAAAARQREEQRQRVRAAIHDASSLRYPLCVMPFARFVAFGQLVPFEEARDKAALVFCDTWDGAARFASNHPLVFLSHQWLSYCAPDPENAHYAHMVRAIEALAEERGFNVKDCLIWCDYHSIPQCNEATKTLAIGSIALFAACTSHFVACAPETPHVDTTLLCNRDTYLSRGWYRLEQWAFMLANGTEAVYFSGAGDGDELQQVADVSSWIETSIMVFLGEFTNDEDRALLVDVVLGLYGLAYVSKLQRGAKSHAKECTGDALWAQLQKHKGRDLPGPPVWRPGRAGGDGAGRGDGAGEWPDEPVDHRAPRVQGEHDQRAVLPQEH